MPARPASLPTRLVRSVLSLLACQALILVLQGPALAQEMVVDDVFPQGLPSDDQPITAYVNIDGIFWTRNMPGVPLMINSGTGAAIASTSSLLDFNVGSGPALTAGGRFDDVLGIEASYFGFYDWHARGRFDLTAGNAATADVPFPNLPALAFDPGDYQTYEYKSDLTSVELNMRADLTDRFNLLWGFRYLNLDENFRSTLYESTNAVFGSYGIQTKNNLFGFQIGSQRTFWLTNSWTLSLNGKVGVFGNAAEQTTSGTFLDGGTGPAQRSASDARASVVSQLGLQTAVQLSRHIAIRGGYQVFYANNVALAASQITTSNWAAGGAGGISTNDELFAHGGNIGFELTW